MGTLTPKGVVLYTSSSDSKQISAIPTLRDAAVRKPRLRPFRASLSWLSGCLDVTLPRRAAITNLAFSIKAFLVFSPRAAPMSRRGFFYRIAAHRQNNPECLAITLGIYNNSLISILRIMHSFLILRILLVSARRLLWTQFSSFRRFTQIS